MTKNQDHSLIERLSTLSSRLDLAKREFAEHGTLSTESEFDHEGRAAEHILFKQFVSLLRYLDGETIKHINEGNHKTTARK